MRVDGREASTHSSQRDRRARLPTRNAPDVADAVLAHHLPLRRPAGSSGGGSRGLGMVVVAVAVVVVAAGPVLLVVVVPGAGSLLGV